MKSFLSILFVLMGWVLLPMQGYAAVQPTTIEQAFIGCKTAYPDSTQAEERLACFDNIHVPHEAMAAHTEVSTAEYGDDCINGAGKPCRYLDRKWRLNSSESKDWSDLETHRLNYLTVTQTSTPNQRPNSHSIPATESRGLDNHDLNFQLSFKTELMRSIPWVRDFPRVETSRVWAAYTQQSYWQVFDSGKSRPMREHNFAPELILSLGLDNKQNGERKAFLPRMANIGLIHESNGRSLPISRSWNRLYVESAWELSDNLTMSVRPWWRIPEGKSKDDNPDISRYLGYGDVRFHWDSIDSSFAANLLLRNNLRRDNKGFAKLDLQFQPLECDNVKLHLMLSDGYGESLIDYNHSQTVLGLGVSIGE